MSGINKILNKIAARSVENRNKELEAMKQAFVPMPGGEAPMDPSMAGGDPMAAMAGAGGDPAMLAAVSGQAPLPEMMAAQGAPVDPAMAMAGGAPLPQDMMAAGADPAAAGAAPEAAPAEGASKEKKPSEKQRTDERLANIEGMLNTLMGAMMAKGFLQPDSIPAAKGINSDAAAEVAPDVVEPMGEPVGPSSEVPEPEEAAKLAEDKKKRTKNLAESLAAAFHSTKKVNV